MGPFNRRSTLFSESCRWLLTLASAGGVVPPPISFFSGMDAEPLADRTEILHSLWDILCATFGEKIDRVRSGHGAITSQEA